MTKKQTTPKWFEGVVYDKGTTVTNPFSGESIELNPTEVALYDYLMGCEIMNNFKDSDVIKDWFLKNNSKAYMTLLD